ncbi:hypothetical protein [Acrocarpospora sp. B8E8]|uniref:hypothetical protein n=1 Tax=Acrocarpospora sp. B8E8 TaxID=3153572 RepID=UPI00325E2354
MAAVGEPIGRDRRLNGVKRSLVAGFTLTVVALCSVAASVLESSTTRSACPQEYGGGGAGGWVPAAADIDGVDDVLVPGQPVSATICAYPGTNTRMGRERLAGSRVVTDDVLAMARDLSYLPTTGDSWDCTQMGGRMINYLIRFDYPGGEALWVGSAEEVNSCVATTNGTVSSRSYVGKAITAAHRTGNWKIEPPEHPCLGEGGRRGQDQSMVPEAPVSVLICRNAPRHKRHARAQYGPQEARSLAAALNSVDHWSTGGSCHGGSGDSFRLMFGYSEGPRASVYITERCDPPVSSPELQANLDDSVRDLLVGLAPTN